MSGFGGGFLLGNNGGNNGGYGGGNGGYGGNGGNGGYGGSYNDNSNYGNSSATKNNNSSPFKGDNRKKGSIIPLTIKKLLEASSRPDDVVEVDGTPVDQAVIIGRAYKLEEQSTRIILHLDDSTGRIQVAYYKKSDTQAQTGLDKYSYEENGYVKAVVVVRPFKTQKMYVSNMLEQIKDFNQISYHFLSTFLASAYRTKGALPKPDPNVQDKLNGTAQKNNNNGTQQGGYQGGNMNLRDQTNNFPVSNNRDPMVVVKDLISKFQHQAVNGYCKQSQLITALKGKMDGHTLDQCLMRLENNAEICRDESNYNDPSFALLGEH